MRARPDTSQVPESLPMNQPHKMPMVTMFSNRDESLDKDSKLINCFAEKDLMTGEYWVQKRPGLELYSTLSGDGRGVYNWNEDIYSIFGATVYKNGVAHGTVDTTNGVYKFIQLRGAPPTLVMGNGVEMYFTDGTTLKQIEPFVPVVAGDFMTGSTYTILTLGDTGNETDYSLCGAAATPIGTTQIKMGNFVVGQVYIIQYPGYATYHSNGTLAKDYRSDFTTIGAANNKVGTAFTATDVGDPKVTPSGQVPPNGHDTLGYAFEAAFVGVGNTFVASNSAAGNGNGHCVLNAISMVAGQSYQIYSVGATDFTLVGAAANTVGTVFVATGPGTDDGTIYVQNAFPDNFCKGFAYLDGTLYVMDTQGVIWGSRNLDDPEDWSPLNYITARVEPDAGVALAKQLVYVIALKEWTTEVFYDAGNPSPVSPLAPVQGAKSPYGCVSAESVQELDDSLYWISSNRSSSPQIVTMVELKVLPISTPAIDRLLDQVTFNNVHSWTLKHGGHKFYGLTLADPNITLVYDIDQGLWYKWTDPDGTYWKIIYRTFTANHLHLVQHESNGCLYLTEGDYEYPTDDGEVFPVDIYTPNTTFNIDRKKFLSMMRFNADQTPGSKIFVRVNDDDYKQESWTNFREVDLSKRRPILLACGSFYRRAWHIRHLAPTAFRIRSVDLQMDIGTF